MENIGFLIMFIDFYDLKILFHGNNEAIKMIRKPIFSISTKYEKIPWKKREWGHFPNFRFSTLIVSWPPPKKETYSGNLITHYNPWNFPSNILSMSPKPSGNICCGIIFPSHKHIPQ